MMSKRFALAAALLGLMVTSAGCSSASDDEDDEEEISAGDAQAVLEIHPLDIWAQALPPKDLKVSVTRDGKRVHAEVGATIDVFVRDPGRYHLQIAAPMHETAEIDLDYDGTNGAAGMKVAGIVSRGTGLSLAHAVRKVRDLSLQSHDVFIGLRHQYFSAQGRPARRGNNVQLMMDGDEAWRTVHSDLKKASKSVNAATWWWESEFELVRDLNPALTYEERLPNTILGIFESIPATKRVIVGQFWGQDSILSWLNTDSRLRAHANATNDNFEFMGQANETRGSFKWTVAPFNFVDRVRAAEPQFARAAFDAEGPIQSTVPSHDVDLSVSVPIAQNFVDGILETASYHQKFMTIDSKLAFVGGMNLRQNDWDSSAHRVFDPRRMKIGASMKNRLDVAGGTRLPDDKPRKDYMVRIDGPSAQDVDDVFHERWEFLRKQGVYYSDKTTPFDVKRDLQGTGTTQLQVTATLPAPFNENAIAETWFNAVRSAKKYIYIEDQYFRIPLLNEAIVQRMREVKDLRLVVITMDVGKTDPACAWSRQAYGALKGQYPDRTFFFQLRTFDPQGTASLAYQEIDTHAKMLMVDDTFMSVGSCNKNNRGIIYEGELNVAVADPVFVADARKRIIGNILAGQPSEDWIADLAARAASNDQAYSAWAADNTKAASIKPEGFIHGLVYPRLDDCILASVGPDRT